MNTPLVIALCLFIFVCTVSCESTSTVEPNSAPLTYVYAVYPFYNSETLLEVWKDNESTDVSANLVTLTPGDRRLSILNSGNVAAVRNETATSDAQGSVQFLRSDTEISSEQLSQNGQQLRNYRNWRRSLNV